MSLNNTIRELSSRSNPLPQVVYLNVPPEWHSGAAINGTGQEKVDVPTTKMNFKVAPHTRGDAASDKTVSRPAKTRRRLQNEYLYVVALSAKWGTAWRHWIVEFRDAGEVCDVADVMVVVVGFGITFNHPPLCFRRCFHLRVVLLSGVFVELSTFNGMLNFLVLI